MILGELKNMGVSDSRLEIIQGWLVSDDGEEEKDRALKEIFDEMFCEANHAGERGREMLAELHSKLNGMGAEFREFKPKTIKQGMPLMRRIPRIAAVVIPLMFAVGIAFWALNGAADNDFVIVTASDNRIQEVTFPDGSSAWIQYGGSLKYQKNFTKNRTVELNGAAFFSVKNEEGKVFAVKTNSLTVEVLGTRFSVKDYDGREEVSVSLLDGAVQVELLNSDHHKLKLSPSEQLIYNIISGEVAVEHIEEYAINGWMCDNMDVDGVPLMKAMEMIGTFYGVDIIVEDSLPSHMEISIFITREDSIEDVFDSLEYITGQLKYEVRNGTIYVFSE